MGGAKPRRERSLPSAATNGPTASQSAGVASTVSPSRAKTLECQQVRAVPVGAGGRCAGAQVLLVVLVRPRCRPRRCMSPSSTNSHATIAECSRAQDALRPRLASLVLTTPGKTPQVSFWRTLCDQQRFAGIHRKRPTHCARHFLLGERGLVSVSLLLTPGGALLTMMTPPAFRHHGMRWLTATMTALERY